MLHGDSSSVPISNAQRWASRSPRPRSWLHSPDGKDTPALGTRKGEGGHGKSRGGSRNGRGRGLVMTGRKQGHMAGVEGEWGGGPGRGLSVTGSSALLWSVMVVGSFEGF